MLVAFCQRFARLHFCRKAVHHLSISVTEHFYLNIRLYQNPHSYPLIFLQLNLYGFQHRVILHSRT